MLKVNVGDDFNIVLREHDIELCEHVAGNKRLDHLTKVLFLKKLYYANHFAIFSSLFQ